ncbi:MAG: tRNA uracil 4-sulfurtransferase ThiI [Erysipelotrichaceae bacterium]
MDEIKYDYIVCRYGELSTKGKNRKDFIACLLSNIKKSLKNYPELEYVKSHDGLFIHLNGVDYDEVAAHLKKTFGMSYFAGAIRCERDMDDIKAKALMISQKNSYKTFKVVARRNDKTFPKTSDEINRDVATHILRNSELKVDVHNPDLKVYITVKTDCAYVMDEKVIASGGYPVGINHKALLMMSGGIDSPVAAYLTMKRGLKVECIHFASMPYTSKQALDKVLELARIVSEYQNDIIVHIVPFTDLQLAIYEHADESYAITVMRRMMYRIASRLCDKRKIGVITNGESVGQVASQTIESMNVISKVSDHLILRPLCSMDKIEIIDLARKIGTYETSILPYEDCCTIFDPKNPVTKPKLDKTEYFESKFDYETLINECIENIETVKIVFNDAKEEEDIF